MCSTARHFTAVHWSWDAGLARAWREMSSALSLNSILLSTDTHAEEDYERWQGKAIKYSLFANTDTSVPQHTALFHDATQTDRANSIANSQIGQTHNQCSSRKVERAWGHEHLVSAAPLVVSERILHTKLATWHRCRSAD